MKNKEYIIISLTLAYSYLFYYQGAGINFLIFNILLIAGLYTTQPALRYALRCNISAAGSLITAVNIVWYSSDLAIVANFLSLLALAGFSLKPQSSYLIALANSGYSLLVSLGKKLLPIPGTESKKIPARNGRLSLGNFLSYTLPVIIFLIFFFLYTAGNPVFETSIGSFLGRGFDLISFGWLFFTLSGFWLVFSFFHQRAISKLVDFDENTSDQIIRKRQRKIRSFSPLYLKYEYKTGWISFGLLNLLIFLFNLIDVFYLFSGKLPEGVSYSAFVHQGVNTLVLSIVLAITIVMYFFRGNLNFFKDNQKLKTMAYCWILQNIVLLIATAYKNGLYIAEYGLTYKRIGVYFYLLLSLVGLITTYVKVYQVKSNWFLFRKNAWIFYAVMVAATFFNWASIVTAYNLSKFAEGKIDIPYLVSLPDKNLDQLYEIVHDPTSQLTKADQKKVIDKINAFVQQYETQGWQSWNFIENRIYQKINQ